MVADTIPAHVRLIAIWGNRAMTATATKIAVTLPTSSRMIMSNCTLMPPEIKIPG